MTEKQAPVEITINRRWCKCCYLCIAVCPTGVYTRSEKVGAKGLAEPLVTYPEKCIKCFLCELSCPDIAITVVEKAPRRKAAAKK
jgi:2-oxoglutarate ferredoxin oxidoreductase subunit delta